jgi:protein PhnA
MGHFSITQAGRSFLLVPERGSRKENDLHTDFDFDMFQPACPVCSLNDVLDFPDHYECATCGHEWERENKASDAARIVKDANGNVLADGDSVTLIKDLKLRGSSEVIKQGTKVRSIRLVDGDHEIDCKVDGVSMALKACFVKKA